MVSEWAHRFYDNIDPPFDERGFDHILSGTRNTRKTGNEALNLRDRMDELEYRISHHAGITATLSLPSSYLAWSKNVQCPPKTWNGLLSDEGKVTYKECKADSHKRICVKWYNTKTYTFVFCFCKDPEPKEWKPGDDPNRRAWKSTSNQKSLILPRHNPYEKSLEIADYVSSYFPPRWSDAIIAYEGNTKQEPHRDYGFWLIDEKYADFVYAILKSSMFRAWCELTAYTEGQGHFTVGMWDTFPLPKLTESQESAIMIAGQKLRKKWPWAQGELNKLVDELFVPALLSQFLTNVDRRQILGKGFLNMFLPLRTDVMSLA